MEKKILETIKKHNLINKGDRVVMGVSGGPDSIALLFSLYKVKERVGIEEIFVVHINHMIRGIEADCDAEYVKNFCNELGIPFYGFREDVKTLGKTLKMTEEEAGRKVRYDAFYKIMNENKCNKIALAHNFDDQAETILMRLMRGTGLDGLAGISYIRDENIIRPLLDVKRNEIEEYCRINDLNPRIDKTNFEPIYSRNKVRLELIPYMEENYSDKIKDSLHRLGSSAMEDKDFIYSFVGEVLERDVKVFYDREMPVKAEMSYESLEAIHPAIRKRLVLSIFSKIGARKNISSVQLEALEDAIREKKTSLEIDFSNNQKVKIRYDKMFFLNEESRVEAEKSQISVTLNKDEEIEIEAEGRFKIKTSLVNITEENISEITDSRKSSDNVAYFSYNEIASNLSLRYRREGDLFSPFGFKGTKKLKKYFIDKKIDRDIRDEIPLICQGNDVLWIVGYEKSSKLSDFKLYDKVFKIYIDFK